MEIFLGKPDSHKCDHSAFYDMFAFRHMIFHDRLKWEVNSIHGMEFDEFDLLSPYHMIALNKDKQVEGYWRLLPTTVPYMLERTFPELLRGEALPKRDNIWEVSRFAVIAKDVNSKAQAVMSDLTLKMFQKTYTFSKERNIDSYVTVISAAMERMVSRAGFPLRRFGDGKTTRIGKVTTVACWMDINEQFRQAAYQNQNSNDH